MTLGEDRVRTTLNPSRDGMVDQLKQKSAELIDMVETIKLAAQRAGSQSELIRLCALAQTAYEEAAMWATKACTAKEEQK